MPRPNEEKARIQCRLPKGKKANLDKVLIEAGFFFRHKENTYPMYGEFLEALLDGDPRASSVILKISSKIFQKPLDR
jgi:hypothetical protein